MTRILALLLCLIAATPALAQATYEEAVLLYEDKDYKGARDIAEAAAKKGDARAMAMLGLFYQKGLGVTADLNKAVDWYAQAADKDNADAQYALAEIYLDGALGEADMERGRFWLIKAAAQGRAEAQHRHRPSRRRSRRHPTGTAAADWFRKAADQDYSDAAI